MLCAMQGLQNDKNDEIDRGELSKTDAVIDQVATALAAALETLARYDLSACFGKFGLDSNWAHRQLARRWSKGESIDTKVADLDAFLENSDLLEELADAIRVEEAKDMKAPALSFEVLRLELHWLAHLASLENVDRELVRREGEAIHEADTRRVFERTRRLSGRAKGMNTRLWEFKGHSWWHIVFGKLDRNEIQLWEFAGALLTEIGKVSVASSHLLETKVGAKELETNKKHRDAYTARILGRTWGWLLIYCSPGWEPPQDVRYWRNNIGDLIRATKARLPQLETATASLAACRVGFRQRE